MQLGLNNRLRLISLLPIVVLFCMSSYYVYTSYKQYKSADQLHKKLGQNAHLNEVVGNLARERGMSSMYLGNKTEGIKKSLDQQRKIVDKKVAEYLQHVKDKGALHSHSDTKDKTVCQACNDIEVFSSLISKIREIRPLVDSGSIEFDEMFMGTYSAAQKTFIQQLEQITHNQIDKKINELYSVYITMVNAKEASGVERGYISYIISRSNKLSENDLNRWISIIAKADSLSYEALHDKDLLSRLNGVFKSEDSVELFEDINAQRTSLISASGSAEYNITPGVWFTMQSEKIKIISQAEKLLIDAMSQRARKVQEESLRVLIITFTVWIIAIILAILGYLLASEISFNIKHLENVLKKVANDTDSEHKKINLHTAEGTNRAYELLEEIIEQTKKDKISAQEASEAKSMFLANMSHEIRTPLNGIVGFTELLKDSGLEEEQSEFVEIIEKSSENLLEIINNILDLSKIESNKLEIENIIFNPIGEFESAVEVYAARASEKNINLGCFIDPSLESPLKGDPTKIKEIIINLLSNAVKFTNSAGSIDVNITKVKTNEIGRTRIKFAIQDNGIGVTNEQKSRIFEAFSQADTSITRKYGGTGLGLTISSNFIELMGGKLDLESIPGQTTTFFFTLDLEEVEILNESCKNSYNNFNVLILNNPSRPKKQDEYLKKYLDYFGVNYKTFEDINDVSRLLKNENYNFLIVDYDYAKEDMFLELSKFPIELVVLSKSNMMKKLDALGLNIYKTLYEPLHSTKLKQIFENYSQKKPDVRPVKKEARKKFDGATSKFDAKVLVAEDNIINQKLIKRTLEDLGLTISLASNGLEAFQKRKDEDFDLIFMDIQMPFLDGVEATKEILEYEEDYNEAHVPIVALTANALKGDRERFLQAGLDEYTTKPLIRSEIISVLNRFLADHIVDTGNKTDKPEVNAPNMYRADILIAKKSSFETRLYTKIIENIGGLTCEVTSSLGNFKELIQNHSYKVVLFDKEYDNIDIEDISLSIRTRSTEKGLKSHVVLVDDSTDTDSGKHMQHVDKIIKNVVNSDMLKSLFIKHT